MYSVEWQKRGPPHACILLWMVEKIRPDEIDDIIWKKIPDPETDPEIYEIVWIYIIIILMDRVAITIGNHRA